MSFQDRSFWLSREAGCLTDENMGYENSSRIEPKQGHQWFLDTGEPDIFNNNKKQAIEATDGRPISGVSHMNISPWDTHQGFHSVPGNFADRLWGSDPGHTANLVDKNISSVRTGSLNMGSKDFDNQYRVGSSMHLSMSQSNGDPSYLNFGGIRKVKVNQVRDADNGMSTSMGQFYSREDSNTISLGSGYNKNDDHTIRLGPSYDNGNGNAITLGDTFSKADNNLVLLGHNFSKEDGNFILMGHNYGRGNDNILSMGQPSDREGGDFISMNQSYDKEGTSIISLSNSYKGHENFILKGAIYNKGGDNFFTIAPSCDKVNEHTTTPIYEKADPNNVPECESYENNDTRSLSIGQNCNGVESNTISFGGFHDEPEANTSGGVISGYEVSEGWKDPNCTIADSNVNISAKENAKIDTVKSKKPKTAKKLPPNNFPSNVKTLLSTGMFDGVPVKYVSWSREKNLKGIIKGTGYLCSCSDCQHSKALNAYEFERHAGAKTKHPNNHIYFENGKTIYAVVQELKNTPQELLFDAIQNVTGSAINQKNFRIWKASYQAATRELQRIYGKDEVIIPS